MKADLTEEQVEVLHQNGVPVEEEQLMFDMVRYQRATEHTAIYPDEFPSFITPELIYVTL